MVWMALAAQPQLEGTPPQQLVPSYHPAYHLPNLVRLKLVQVKLGSSDASFGVGGTALTASAFSSLIGAGVNGAGVGAILLVKIN